MECLKSWFSFLNVCVHESWQCIVLLIGVSWSGTATCNACADSYGGAVYWSWCLHCMYFSLKFNLYIYKRAKKSLQKRLTALVEQPTCCFSSDYASFCWHISSSSCEKVSTRRSAPLISDFSRLLCYLYLSRYSNVK